MDNYFRPFVKFEASWWKLIWEIATKDDEKKEDGGGGKKDKRATEFSDEKDTDVTNTEIAPKEDYEKLWIRQTNGLIKSCSELKGAWINDRRYWVVPIYMEECYMEQGAHLQHVWWLDVYLDFDYVPLGSYLFVFLLHKYPHSIEWLDFSVEEHSSGRIQKLVVFPRIPQEDDCNISRVVFLSEPFEIGQSGKVRIRLRNVEPILKHNVIFDCFALFRVPEEDVRSIREDDNIYHSYILEHFVHILSRPRESLNNYCLNTWKAPKENPIRFKFEVYTEAPDLTLGDTKSNGKPVYGKSFFGIVNTSVPFARSVSVELFCDCDLSGAWYTEPVVTNSDKIFINYMGESRYLQGSNAYNKRVTNIYAIEINPLVQCSASVNAKQKIVFLNKCGGDVQFEKPGLYELVYYYTMDEGTSTTHMLRCLHVRGKEGLVHLKFGRGVEVSSVELMEL